MSDLGAIFETGGAAAVEYAASKIAEHGGRPGTCTNCNEPLIGPFCAVCGQPRDVHRRAIHHLLADLFTDIISFDSRILRTARALMLQPGELAKAYHDGRTQPFVPPVRLYLFVSLIFFLALSVALIALFQFDLHVANQVVRKDAGGVFIEKGGERIPLPGFTTTSDGHLVAPGNHIRKSKVGDTTYTVTAPPMFLRQTGHVPPVPAQVKTELAKMQHDTMSDKGDDLGARIQRVVAGTMNKLAEDPAALNAPMTEWLPRLLFVLVPLFAVLLALFHWRRRRDYFFVDHLVFSLNYHSFGFALLVLALLPAQFLPQLVLLPLLFAVMSLYLLLAMKRFYGQGWPKTVLKFAAFGFIYVSFILGPAFLGLLIVSVTYA
jgi:hypothetical protein